jgi:hypothetical protein
MSCQEIRCYNISFSGVFKTNINQQTLINFSKAIISSDPKLLFTEEPQVTLTTAEDKTEITTLLSALNRMLQTMKLVGYH